MEFNVLMCSSIFHVIHLLEATKSNELYKKVELLKKDNVDAYIEKGISLLISVTI